MRHVISSHITLHAIFYRFTPDYPKLGDTDCWVLFLNVLITVVYFFDYWI